MDLPYMLVKHSTGTFAYFRGGAIRRTTGLIETIVLENNKAVKVTTLKTSKADNAEAAHAAKVSKTLFGI